MANELTNEDCETVINRLETAINNIRVGKRPGNIETLQDHLLAWITIKEHTRLGPIPLSR